MQRGRGSPYIGEKRRVLGGEAIKETVSVGVKVMKEMGGSRGKEVKRKRKEELRSYQGKSERFRWHHGKTERFRRSYQRKNEQFRRSYRGKSERFRRSYRGQSERFRRSY